MLERVFFFLTKNSQFLGQKSERDITVCLNLFIDKSALEAKFEDEIDGLQRWPF